MDPRTLRLTLALASVFKEGDRSLVGEADDRVRADARRALLATTVGDIHAAALIDDRVSELLQRSRDRRFDAEFRLLTIGRVREALHTRVQRTRSSPSALRLPLTRRPLGSGAAAHHFMRMPLLRITTHLPARFSSRSMYTNSPLASLSP